MNHEARRQQLLAITPAEEIYRRLYRQHPQVYFYDRQGELFEDWATFSGLYRRSAPPGFPLPEQAPTIMSNTLLEQNFFQENGKDVCCVINARYCPPFWHHLNFIKIMYVLNGEILINISEDRHIILKKGNFIISPPNIKQSVFSYHDEDVVINIFLRISTFEKTFSSLLQESNDLAPFFWQVMYGKDENSLIWFQMDTDAQLDDMVYRLLEEWLNPKSGGNFYMISHVMAFLGHALYYHRDAITSIWNTRLQKNTFPAVIQYIHDHYNTVTLPSLAEHFGKSEGYMSRYIKQETGYSLTDLLREFKMKQAGKMIRDTRCSITQIMYEVGYTDISYFYRAFKSYYGMTPSEFRKKDKVILL